jgi:hypothetical protein
MVPGTVQHSVADLDLKPASGWVALDYEAVKALTVRRRSRGNASRSLRGDLKAA